MGGKFFEMAAVIGPLLSSVLSFIATLAAVFIGALLTRKNTFKQTIVSERIRIYSLYFDAFSSVAKGKEAILHFYGISNQARLISDRFIQERLDAILLLVKRARTSKDWASAIHQVDELALLIPDHLHTPLKKCRKNRLGPQNLNHHHCKEEYQP